MKQKMSTNVNSDFLSSKKGLKWYESRIEDFNSTVPFQLNVLQNCKNNILKQYKLENYAALKQERITAQRTIRHLKQLLIDSDRLREQVSDNDLHKFDKLVCHSRENIITSLKNFDDFYNTLYIPPSDEDPNLKNYCMKYEEELENTSNKQVLLYENVDSWDLRQQIETAQSMERIREDVQTVNEIFQELSSYVQVQKENVDSLEKNVESSHERVVAAEKEIAQVAAKIHGTAYPLVGAVLGSCVGGPIGFLAGLKIGTGVAITGSILGFSGGKIIKMKQEKVRKEALKDINNQQKTKT